MNFIASKSSDYKFLLDDSTTEEGMNRSHEDNLVMTELITDQITQVTNAYQKSNYTFKLIKQSGTDGNYFLNLVVKEYKDTFYLYIVKYVPDALWLNAHSMTNDMGDFTGSIYFYSDQGIYVANLTVQNGSSTSSSYNPCPNDTDDGIEDPDDDGTGGGGGEECTFFITWYQCQGSNANFPHSADECNAAEGPQTGSGFNYEWVCSGNNNYSANNLNNVLRNPCGGTGGATGGATGGGTYCQPDPDCVFPMQLDENCDCVEAQEIESNEVAVVVNLKTPCGKLNNLMDETKANIKPSLEQLKETLGESGENGVQFKKDNTGTYSNVILPATTTNTINFASGGDNYGGVHTHPSSAYPMFSWGDIYSLLQLHQRAAIDAKLEVSFMLIAKPTLASESGEVYALTIDNYTTFTAKFNEALNNITSSLSSLSITSPIDDKINELNKVLGTKYDKDNNRERVFLKQFKEFGITLSKANDDLTNWSTLAINEAINSVLQTPCN